MALNPASIAFDQSAAAYDWLRKGNGLFSFPNLDGKSRGVPKREIGVHKSTVRRYLVGEYFADRGRHSTRRYPAIHKVPIKRPAEIENSGRALFFEVAEWRRPTRPKLFICDAEEVTQSCAQRYGSVTVVELSFVQLTGMGE